ncbi:hypothetical protein AWB69_06461 [Caballeronia udeis]|uniref:Uncharacterized protein n=1 Tax=Caballeronia udeis TaxID=1232866 RepID=A0A158IPW1_9BURK|nr:hypothetical protein AWB69_06461 [Caballeronia udeis]
MPAPIIHYVISIPVFVGQPISLVPIQMRDGAAAAIISLFATVPTVLVRATLITRLAPIARMRLVAIPVLIIGAAVILGTTCRGRMPFLREYGQRCSS